MKDKRFNIYQNMTANPITEAIEKYIAYYLALGCNLKEIEPMIQKTFNDKLKEVLKKEVN